MLHKEVILPDIIYKYQLVDTNWKTIINFLNKNYTDIEITAIETHASYENGKLIPFSYNVRFYDHNIIRDCSFSVGEYMVFNNKNLSEHLEFLDKHEFKQFNIKPKKKGTFKVSKKIVSTAISYNGTNGAYIQKTINKWFKKHHAETTKLTGLREILNLDSAPKKELVLDINITHLDRNINITLALDEYLVLSSDPADLIKNVTKEEFINLNFIE